MFGFVQNGGQTLLPALAQHGLQVTRCVFEKGPLARCVEITRLCSEHIIRKSALAFRLHDSLTDHSLSVFLTTHLTLNMLIP